MYDVVWVWGRGLDKQIWKAPNSGYGKFFLGLGVGGEWLDGQVEGSLNVESRLCCWISSGLGEKERG